MNQDTSDTSDKNYSSLPPPLSWIANFITKYYSNMPKAVQVSVFLIFVAYFVLASIRLLWPLLFPDEYREVRGEVTFLNSEALPDSMAYIEFSGEGLYVYKKPVGLGNKFTYEWILKTPRNKYSEKTRLIFTKYNPCNGRQVYLTGLVISAEQLDKLSSDEKVHLEVDSMFTQIFTNPEEFEESSEPIARALRLNLFTTPAYAQNEKIDIKPMSVDTVDYLINQYEQYRNPVARLKIIDIVSDADTAAVIAQAEKLRQAVIEGDEARTANLSLILSNFELVTILSHDERYQSILDQEFYDRATDIFHTRDDYVVRAVAEFLKTVEDPRCIDGVFTQFYETDDARTKLILLNILKGFSDHPDTNVRNKIHEKLEGWTESLDSTRTDSKLRRPFKETIRKFEMNVDEK